MNKKKILSIFLVCLMMFLVTACGAKQEKEQPAKTEQAQGTAQAPVKSSEKVRLYALKGPTALGLLKVFRDTDEGKAQNKYQYKIMASPEEVVAAIGKGDFDLAALPSNLAAVLFNKTQGKGLKVVNVNTLGVLYIASKKDVKSLEDLKGKTLIMSGKGSTPEYVLRHLLIKNHIDPESDLTIEFKSQHEEVLSALNQNPDAIVMLPQPFLTVAMKKIPDLKVNLSLNDLWSGMEKDSKLVTGVLVANPKFIQEHPKALEAFEQEYGESVKFVNKNADQAAQLAEKYGIVKAPIAKEAIPRCNIVYMEGTEMKETLSNYLRALFEQEPKSVGGSLPNDEFYYTK